MEMNYIMSYGAAAPSVWLLRKYGLLDILLPFQVILTMPVAKKVHSLLWPRQHFSPLINIECQFVFQAAYLSDQMKGGSSDRHLMLMVSNSENVSPCFRDHFLFGTSLKRSYGNTAFFLWCTVGKVFLFFG